MGVTDLNDLYYFAQVIDHGGFASASRALGEPKSKLSRRLAALEGRLGTRLIQRSTRSISLTEIGEAYYRHCKAMLVEAESAQEIIERSRAEPCGIVRMTCPVALLETRVGEMVTEFMLGHQRVEVHLEATDRPVDLITEGIDVAIRVRPPPLADSELVMRKLSDRGQCLVAGPSLLERYPIPVTPEDLASFPSMAISRPQRKHTWHLVGPAGEEADVEHHPRYVTHNMTALRSAARAGVGVVQFPNMMIRDDLEAGHLVRLLPDWAPPREVIHAVFPSRRGLLPSVRALVDFLADRFEAIRED
jgi:DNA-binding transcriptional LysR family regulator